MGYASTPEFDLGGSFFRPYEPWQAETFARLSRLTRADDPAVGEAAARLQPILRCGYQLNSVNADFGNTPENGAKSSANMISRGFDFARSFVADEERSEDKIVYGGAGRAYYVQGEPFHFSQESQDALAAFQGEYGSMCKDVEGQTIFSGIVEMCRGTGQREAAEIWEKMLFPRLAALGNQTPAQGLVEVGAMFQFPAPWAFGRCGNTAWSSFPATRRGRSAT